MKFAQEKTYFGKRWSTKMDFALNNSFLWKHIFNSNALGMLQLARLEFYTIFIHLGWKNVSMDHDETQFLIYWIKTGFWDCKSKRSFGYRVFHLLITYFKWLYLWTLSYFDLCCKDQNWFEEWQFYMADFQFSKK